MVEPSNEKISIANQCRVLKISRSTFYYKKKPVKRENLDLMRLIDEQYLEHPSFGSRSMRRFLEKKSYKINRKRVQRLMRQMGIEAIYPKPRTSIPHPEHKVYPYLLRKMPIKTSNKVWAADITYSAPRPGIGRGAYPWNACNKKNEMPCFSLWKSMSPSGGDLLLTSRVT